MDSPTASLRASLLAALTRPTAARLWKLRADLLESGVPRDDKVWGVLGEFRRYLDQLATSTSSREYSHLASKLDIGAVGGVVAEQMLEAKDSAEASMRVLTGILSEGLMVLATRQHVKAWEGELESVYRGAAWYLYEELWRWAEAKKPDLPSPERRHLLDRLLGPVHSTEASGVQKALLLGHLFQVLLFSHLSEALASRKG